MPRKKWDELDHYQRALQTGNWSTPILVMAGEARKYGAGPRDHSYFTARAIGDIKRRHPDWDDLDIAKKLKELHPKLYSATHDSIMRRMRRARLKYPKEAN